MNPYVSSPTLHRPGSQALRPQCPSLGPHPRRQPPRRLPSHPHHPHLLKFLPVHFRPNHSSLPSPTRLPLRRMLNQLPFHTFTVGVSSSRFVVPVDLHFVRLFYTRRLLIKQLFRIPAGWNYNLKLLIGLVYVWIYTALTDRRVTLRDQLAIFFIVLSHFVFELPVFRKGAYKLAIPRSLLLFLILTVLRLYLTCCRTIQSSHRTIHPRHGDSLRRASSVAHCIAALRQSRRSARPMAPQGTNRPLCPGRNLLLCWVVSFNLVAAVLLGVVNANHRLLFFAFFLSHFARAPVLQSRFIHALTFLGEIMLNSYLIGRLD